MRPAAALCAAGALCAAVVAAVVGVMPAAAYAGDGVVSSFPVDGTALDSAPAEVRLTFGAAPDAAESHLAVYDSTEARLNSGPLRGSGKDGLRQAVRPAARGDVVVAYHVVLSDGTELAGQVRFSVGTGLAPARADNPVVARANAAVAGHRHGVDPIGATVLVVDGIVLAGAVILLFLRPARRPKLD
jgi:methionine-rich copper-binding protein CopC